MQKRTITNRSDIEFLVERFYHRALKNEVIGHFFNEVVKLDLEHHIPVICDFWETTLLGNRNYLGNPMDKHLSLNKKANLTAHHFDEWLSLWNGTVDEHFVGKKAQEAKVRANQIAKLMQFKISNA
ncbi:group III truncated hemoglobin [Fulvivirga sp. RKSG066]|uniref:group III truncated hemoglobin n=1 Tax=Fulvivirga aurantia TaxID=2529383 RepID=UPI0012BCD69C|nr:group III truncated hemoglobin [Fulvivirga aurantia]MTI22744.1 group III truncated hemoglobin [Fulvivirga aurantia]